MVSYHVQIRPGENIRDPAPLKHVVREDERPHVEVSKHTTYSRDEGIDCHLIAGYVNGSRETFLGKYTVASNEQHPPHYHPAAAEWYYVLEGTGTILVGDEEVDAAPGVAVYLPAGTIHAVSTGPDETLTILYGFNISDTRYAGTTWIEE